MKDISLIFLLMLSGYCLQVKAQPLPELIPYNNGHHWGYADTNGNIILKPRWEHVNFFQNGRAVVSLDYKKAGNDVCLIDRKGNYIISPKDHWNGRLYNSWADVYYNAHGNGNDEWGVIDSLGNRIIPYMYTKTGWGNVALYSGHFCYDSLQHNYFAVVDKGGRYGLIDTANRIIIPFEYDGFLQPKDLHCSPDIYGYKLNNKFGLINIHNQVLLSADYDNITYRPAGIERGFGFDMYHNGAVSAIADANGKLIIDIPAYNIIQFSKDSLLSIRDNSTYHRAGLMNFKKELLIPCIYSEVLFRNDSIVLFRLDTAKDKISRYKQILAGKDLKPVSQWMLDTVYELVYKPPSYNYYDNVITAPYLDTPWFKEMLDRGSYQTKFRMDSIIWRAEGVRDKVFGVLGVKGRSVNKDSICYIALIDTKGHYVCPPRKSTATISNFNLRDSLLVLNMGKPDSFECVTDFNLHTILKYQDNGILTAFYFQKKFYAIKNNGGLYYDKKEKHLRKKIPEQYYFSLIDSNNSLVKGFEKYNFINAPNRFGNASNLYNHMNVYNQRERSFVPYEPCRQSGFPGLFCLRDNASQKMGIIDLSGKILYPSLSFKYQNIVPLYNNVFWVMEHQPEEIVNKPGYKKMYKVKRGLYRGGSYFVDSNNNVLLNNASVQSIYLVHPSVFHPEDTSLIAPLFEVYFINKRKNNYFYNRFYMDVNGRAFYKKGKL